MTSAQIKELLDTVVSDIDQVADYAGIVDPSLLPIIALGTALDKLVPGIAESVANIFESGAPSQSALSQKAAELSVLGDKTGI